MRRSSSPNKNKGNLPLSAQDQFDGNKYAGGFFRLAAG